MSALWRSARSIVRRVRSAGRAFLFRESADAGLVALADEYLANEWALGALLAGDGRDADDIPGSAPLADR